MSWYRSAVRTCLLVVAVCVMAACSTTPAPPPPPAPAPPPAPVGPPPSLDGWKLTLPTANAKGDAASVDPAQPSPPFLTTDDRGALVFWAPVAGATTKNSDHTRTELVSLNPFRGGKARHALNATLIVNQVPNDTRDVIVAQIHGSDDISSVPFVMVHYMDGLLKVVVKQQQSGTQAQSIPLTNVELGAPFDVGIVDNGDGSLTLSANVAGDQPQTTVPLPAAFNDATVRFQVGAYQQSISTGTAAGPDDGARVTFSSLTTS